MFTNDENYLKSRTKLIPVRETVGKKDSKKVDDDNQKQPPKDDPPKDNKDKDNKDKDKDTGFFGTIKNTFAGKKDDPPKGNADPFA